MSLGLPVEHLQPSLLDRLVSDDPRGSDGIEERVWSRDRLRASLLRDLELLLNTTCARSREGVHRHARASRSIMNFGLPALAGMYAVKRDPEMLAEMVRDAVNAFEPRVLEETLGVRPRTVADEEGIDEVSIEIEGEFCPLPAPELLFVQAMLEADSGAFRLKDRANE